MHEGHSCLLALFPMIADGLESSTGKKLLIAKGVKNGKGTQRAATTTGSADWSAAGRVYFWPVDLLSREKSGKGSQAFNPT